MAMQEFKAESKRLLELMIGSIYTHKEIFLRELISNASDAIDKMYFKSLTDDSIKLSRDDFEINIAVDKDARTVTITDNGIGMTKEELENNLGTIAKSGSLAFKNENEQPEDISVIGQFGVGFYSAFMVAKKVTVTSKAFGSQTAYRWTSEGVEGYEIETAERDEVGTTIVLYIKEDTDEERYSEYLDSYRISSLIKRYSDYIHYPIKMPVEKSRKKEDSDEYETYTEIETLNTMLPLWRKNKSEIKEEEYKEFYKNKFYDYEDPIATIHTKTEGTATYDALMFIPTRAPYDYYTKEFQKGLQLYSNGVLIMDKCSDLLPDYLAFVRGLVDSQDLSLNISREMLQHDRQLTIIAKNIEKKILSELKSICNNKREKYETFWSSFGRQIKFGAYDSFGMNKEKLQDLLLFTSSYEEKLVTLDEYISRMKPDQNDIYYVTGENITRCKNLPQTEFVLEKGFEILYLTEDVDEFCIKILDKYKEKGFKSIQDGDFNIDTEDEKKATEKLTEENKPLLEEMQLALGDKVNSIRISNRLKNHAVCITTDGNISLEMEKVLNQMPQDNSVKAKRVLEINPNHKIFALLQKLNDSDKDKLKELTDVLYTQALIVEGVAIENPSEYSAKVCDLLSMLG